MTAPSATATVQIDASPEAVYGLITDLPTLASLAEEAVKMELRKGAAVTEGAVFVGHNENGGKRWTTKCTVTDADPGVLSRSTCVPRCFRSPAGNTTSRPPRTAAAG